MFSFYPAQKYKRLETRSGPFKGRWGRFVAHGAKWLRRIVNGLLSKSDRRLSGAMEPDNVTGLDSCP